MQRNGNQKTESAKLPVGNRNGGESTTMEGNEAVASVAYRMSENIAIYPITPSTPMGEFADEWASRDKPNLWGNIPKIVEMQSEAGVAGTLHGMLQGGSMATTFTASQGLLLMIPILYKLAGQLIPCCIHVSARAVATHGLSIFGDHSDVMGIRQTGVALLSSANPQEAQDCAAIAHAATLESRIPFVHFFDGFRTSHEINDVTPLSAAVLRNMLDPKAVEAHVLRGMTPDRPGIRGTAQNPDVFFQAREAANGFYQKLPEIVEGTMARFAELTGRSYRLLEYHGDPEAEHVVIVMGSGFSTVRLAVDALRKEQGKKVGVLQVRLFRPFPVEHLEAVLPQSVRRIAVLDRTKEPGAPGEPLYQDVVTALSKTRPDHLPEIFGGRFGLASKEFTPSMAIGVFQELASSHPRNGFTVGIEDDVTRLSIDYDRDLEIPMPGVTQAVFFGLGSDGTVGANKNTIKIIGTETGNFAQAYFVYDSKKSGGVTVSHLRFGTERIDAPFLITQADFVGCHQWHLLSQLDIVGHARPGGTLLINSPYPAAEVWQHLDRETREAILEKQLRVFVIDAYGIARQTGMGGRINTVMQVGFFVLSDVLETGQAIAAIKEAIDKTYGKKGIEVVAKNHAAVDAAVGGLVEVSLPKENIGGREREPVVSLQAPEFVQRVEAAMLAGHGDLLPVSAFPPDGVWPSGTARWEKRNLATEIPAWNAELCIQCNKCAMVCPHAAIRAKYYPTSALENAPEQFLSLPFRSPTISDHSYTIQVAPEDCTGCRLCIEVCPAKDKTNPKRKALEEVSQIEVRRKEAENFEFFLGLPSPDRSRLQPDVVKDSQFMEPLFEFSGACEGCGETPYIKLLTQLYGDRAVIANATGCSSIYGGNLPTTPFTTDAAGRGPAWANSLFEDNAEFGLGIRMGIDSKRDDAHRLLQKLAPKLGDDLVRELIENPTSTELDVAAQRERISRLKEMLTGLEDPSAKQLHLLADYLVEKSVWIVGGDGWAYDIGFSGLDHVFSLGANLNILVLDTEVYSNTGGQQSKATSIGAVAKFAAGGKERGKKDLAMHAVRYGDVYVARVAFGAKDSQTARAFHEAASYPGTSLILAYSHCIAHGYPLQHGLRQQKLAVDSGYWPLFRHDPLRKVEGKNPFVLDSPAPKIPVENFMENEIRFRLLRGMDPDRWRFLGDLAQKEVDRNYSYLRTMADSQPETAAVSNPS